MKNSGFSLIELLIVMALMGIILSIGIPNFQSSIKKNKLVATSNGLVGAFNFARSEAVTSGSQIFLGQRNGTSWTGGIVVWRDLDGKTDGSWDEDEELRLWDAAPPSTEITSLRNRTNFQFQPTGEVDNDDEVTLCDDRVGEQGIRIILLVSGMIASERVTCV